MDDQTRAGLLSGLIPDEIEAGLGLGEKKAGDAGEQDSVLVTMLKGLVGSSNRDLADSISDFLGGKGSLLEITQAALTRGKKTASAEVAAFLSATFKIPEATAGLIAPILLKIFPGIKKLTGSGETKPRRKKKATSSTASSTAKKKKKVSSSSKPKKTTASSSAKAKKKKTTGSSGSSRPAAKKPRRRSGEISLDKGREEVP